MAINEAEMEYLYNLNRPNQKAKIDLSCYDFKIAEKDLKSEAGNQCVPFDDGYLHPARGNQAISSSEPFCFQITGQKPFESPCISIQCTVHCSTSGNTTCPSGWKDEKQDIKENDRGIISFNRKQSRTV